MRGMNFGWLGQVQHWWIWLLVAFLFGIVGVVTGSTLSLCISLGALAAALASIFLSGVVEWMAFLFISFGTFAFLSALRRRRQRMALEDPKLNGGEGNDEATSS